LPLWTPKNAIYLAENERQSLETLIRKHKTPVQIALRAQIILYADDGFGNNEISRCLKISVDMVRYQRKRFVDQADKEILIADRLKDVQRPGAPAKFTMEQQPIYTLLPVKTLKTQNVRSVTGAHENRPMNLSDVLLLNPFQHAMSDVCWKRRI